MVRLRGGSYSRLVAQGGKKITAMCAALFVTFAMLISPQPAKAADFPGQVEPGYEVNGILDMGPVWFGALENPNGANWLAWCIEMGVPSPTRGDAVTAQTLRTVRDNGQPAELRLTTPQLAWVLQNKEHIATADSRAAISYLVHANYEQGLGAVSGSSRVATMVSVIRSQHPQVDRLAQQYASEARNSAPVGFKQGSHTGEGQREGTINNLGVQNASGGWVAGRNVSVTLNGPAVFKSTGKAAWSGKTGTTPITLEWRSTGNGKVTYTVKYQGHRTTLTKYDANGNVQDTLSYGNPPANDPEYRNVDGPTWDVIFDFQPQATTVADPKVGDDGTISDKVTVMADPTYGDGKWVQIDGTYVPVTFEGTAYYLGERPAAETATVPEGAQVLGTATFTADKGPGEYSVTLDKKSDPGFVTWVWKVVKANQGESAKYVKADWSDKFGIANETQSIRWQGVVESTINVKKTHSNMYFEDDLWISNLPSDHGQFDATAGFKADVANMTHSMLFFPKGVEPTEDNKSQAEVLGSVEIPLRNGHVNDVADMTFKAKLDENGNPVAGTYVFVSSFPGDDRVAPFTSAVTDTNESIPFGLEEIGTEASVTPGTDQVAQAGGPVTITDTVQYHKLNVGQSYTIQGTLMNQATGEPIVIDGEQVTAQTTFVAPTSDGTVELVYEIADSAALSGTTTVVFEDLYRDGVKVASHADLHDDAQTVYFPEIGTSLVETNGLSHMVAQGDENVVLRDTVSYKALKPGVEYTMSGVLMDKATGKPVDGLEAHTTFTPTQQDGTVDVEFTIEGPSDLRGMTLVAFEKLTLGETTVATHEDINDGGQTVRFPDAHTSATDNADGDKILAPTGTVTVKDTVAFTGLEVGKEYTVTGTLMDKATGEPIMNGETPVTSTATVTPDEPDGTVDVLFEVDAKLLATKTVVAFETVSQEGREIIVHADLNDKDQTVYAPRVSTKAVSKIEAGGKAHDTALVEGELPGPLTLTFEAFKAPADGAKVCEASNRVFTTTFGTVEGPGEYTSADTTFTEPGTYYWVETVTDASGTVVHKGACGEPSETTVVSAKGDGGRGAGGNLARTGAGVPLAVMSLLGVCGLGLAATRRRMA